MLVIINNFKLLKRNIFDIYNNKFIIRGIYYRDFFYIKKYINYFNLIKISSYYLNNNSYLSNIIYICKKKKVIPIINLKKNYEINNFSFNLEKWIFLKKKILEFLLKNKINNIYIINIPCFIYKKFFINKNIFKIIENIFLKFYKKLNIILSFCLIKISKKIYKNIKEFLYFIINRNISILIEIKNLHKLIKNNYFYKIISFFQKKDINFLIKIKKKREIKFLKKIIYCKDGIRQTSIKCSLYNK